MKRGVDYIGVGIGAVVFNDKGQLFLSQRGNKAQNERGKWEFPGGALEFGESFEATIIREIKEEFGLGIKPLYQLEPFNHLLLNEHQHWVALCFVCKFVSGEPKILEPDKCQDIGWFTLEAAKNLNLTMTAVQRIKQLEKQNTL